LWYFSPNTYVTYNIRTPQQTTNSWF